MKTEYLKIDMDLVKEIIRDNGYYYITAERLFDKHFVGPKLYIVTDDPEFSDKHPELAKMTIMNVAEFEPIAEAVNASIRNEDRERHRDSVGYIDGLIPDPNNAIEKYHIRLAIDEALKTLRPKLRRRFVMYHIMGLSLEQISYSEGAKKSAVCESIKRAEKQFAKAYIKASGG